MDLISKDTKTLRASIIRELISLLGTSITILAKKRLLYITLCWTLAAREGGWIWLRRRRLCYRVFHLRKGGTTFLWYFCLCLTSTWKRCKQFLLLLLMLQLIRTWLLLVLLWFCKRIRRCGRFAEMAAGEFVFRVRVWRIWC